MCLVSARYVHYRRHPTWLTSCFRLILYFPVSALMTLFSNILQNPLDPRAKSDTRLMDLVVTFLSMLGQEAEQGGVHRMLGICSEFVRIAKVVIERSEKEQSSRRKRKNMDGSKGTKLPPVSFASVTNNTTTSETPRPPTATTTASSTTPRSKAMAVNETPVNDSSPANSYGHGGNASMGEPSPNNGNWQQDYQPPQNGDYDSYNVVGGFSAPGTSPMPVSLGAQSLAQPLLPPDLFGLPATFDWSWAEMSGGAYPSVENGNFGGNRDVGDDQHQHPHQQHQQ